MKTIFCLIRALLAALLFCCFSSSAWAETPFVLDGKFNDWEGRASLDDVRGDGGEGEDFKLISWGTNENEQKLYFMIERYTPADPTADLTCRLYFDINNNGKYEDSIDKYVEIIYRPDHPESGLVEVQIHAISGKLLKNYHGNWGEGYAGGGEKCEFDLPMSTLDIYPAQPVRFYLSDADNRGDRLPGRGDNLWAPFPASVKSWQDTAVIFLIWLIIAFIFCRHRIWIFYYVWAAVGLTFILIFLIRGSPVEQGLEHLAGLAIHNMLSCFDIKTYIFDKSPGTLLVLIDVDNSWTTLDIDIENSGLLEMCIFAGLLLFYPAYGRRQKFLYVTTGITAVYLINILRLVTVIVLIHWGGRNMMFLAHTIFGRLVFFVLVVGLYWNVFTRPSLKKNREQVENG